MSAISRNLPADQKPRPRPSRQESLRQRFAALLPRQKNVITGLRDAANEDDLAKRTGYNRQSIRTLVRDFFWTKDAPPVENIFQAVNLLKKKKYTFRQVAKKSGLLRPKIEDINHFLGIVSGEENSEILSKFRARQASAPKIKAAEVAELLADEKLSFTAIAQRAQVCLKMIRSVNARHALRDAEKIKKIRDRAVVETSRILNPGQRAKVVALLKNNNPYTALSFMEIGRHYGVDKQTIANINEEEGGIRLPEEIERIRCESMQRRPERRFMQLCAGLGIAESDALSLLLQLRQEPQPHGAPLDRRKVFLRNCTREIYSLNTLEVAHWFSDHASHSLRHREGNNMYYFYVSDPKATGENEKLLLSLMNRGSIYPVRALRLMIQRNPQEVRELAHQTLVLRKCLVGTSPNS